MGKRAIYCGGAGNGSASFVNSASSLIILDVQMIPTHSWYWIFKAAKICNNMAMAISMLGVSEAFALGQNLGIKASTLTDIFNCSSARCWSRYCLFSYPISILVAMFMGSTSSSIGSVAMFYFVYWCIEASFLKVQICCIIWIYVALFSVDFDSDTYNPVPGVMEGVPSSRNYDGGFTSKLMVLWQ